MLIDTHCHLDEDAFSGDIERCLDRCREAGVMRVITIGTTHPAAIASEMSRNTIVDRFTYLTVTS